MRFKLSRFLAIVIVMLLISATSADALAKGAKRKGGGKKGGGGNSAALKAAAEADIAKMKAALDYVRNRLAAASGAEADAASRIKAVLSGLEGAKSSLRNARLTVQELEHKALASQGEDSDFKKAEKAYHTAKQKLADDQKRVLNSPDYLAKKEEASSAADKSEEFANVRKYALDNDNEYQESLRNYKDTKVTYENLRQELLKQDPDWAAASKVLLEATAEESFLEAKLQASLVSDSAARETIRYFEQIGMKAQARLASDEAIAKSSASKGKSSKKKK